MHDAINSDEAKWFCVLRVAKRNDNPKLEEVFFGGVMYTASFSWRFKNVSMALRRY